jgi:hypothetical protein
MSEQEKIILTLIELLKKNHISVPYSNEIENQVSHLFFPINRLMNKFN